MGMEVVVEGWQGSRVVYMRGGLLKKCHHRRIRSDHTF